ncbi:MAG: hypothetical protein ACE5KA_07520 [Nitrososphaerales archaeon]
MALDPRTNSNMDPLQIPDYICKHIINMDKTIRFVGIIDFFGHIVAAEYREGLVPLLSQQETRQSFIQSIMRMNTRKSLEAKLGRTLYAFASYEKVKRAAIPLSSDYVLIVAFDVEADHDLLIREKILPLAAKHPY